MPSSVHQKEMRLDTVVPGLIKTPLGTILADEYASGYYEGLCRKQDNQVATGKMWTHEGFVQEAAIN